MLMSFTLSSGLNLPLTAVTWYKSHSAHLTGISCNFGSFPDWHSCPKHHSQDPPHTSPTASPSVTLWFATALHNNRLPHSLQELRPTYALITLQQFLQRNSPLNVKFYFPFKSLRGFGPDHIRYPSLQQLQPQQLHVDLNFTWYSPLSIMLLMNSCDVNCWIPQKQHPLQSDIKQSRKSPLVL